MKRALAIALVLAVAALAHVSAQSPQIAKPFLATQYATVRPAFTYTPVLASPAQTQLVLAVLTCALSRVAWWAAVYMPWNLPGAELMRIPAPPN